MALVTACNGTFVAIIWSRGTEAFFFQHRLHHRFQWQLIVFYSGVRSPGGESWFRITEARINTSAIGISDSLYDKPTSQVSSRRSSVHSLAEYKFLAQIKEMETKLHKPIEQQLKSLEYASKQTNAVTMDTTSRVVDEYRDMERRKLNLIVFNLIYLSRSLWNPLKEKQKIENSLILLLMI